ncbi:uncharacterized protein LOC131975919 [Centropristis striata]|uniref:uncharacterized protein LOC131975919 n=1 Tax=Centropristis striata TaxID=184440 RepID=UPI0027DF95AD|nr:uncharacterized protein LOC131975919 [Centropristis striata]
MHVKWSTEDNTPRNGNRFRFESPSGCLSKLFITVKPTDHQRTWTCQLHQNDTVKASILYTTTIKDGIEEVVAAVGESVSLSCSNDSSLSVGGVKRAEGERTLTHHMSPYEGQTHVINDSSLVISKVSALHAGDYQCSWYTGQLNKIRLYTLDVTSEHGPGGDNLTLTCVLSCSNECGKDFNLTWSGGSPNSWQSGLINADDTLTNRLFLPLISTTDEITCSVHREGEVMASMKWRTVNSLQTPAWVALPLALLICITAGGLCIMYMKRKRNKDAGNEQTSIDMTHVYEVIQDENNEEAHQQSQTKRGRATTSDSFYDLLQAVN